MDIGATANIDQQMENERNAGMMDATKLLIHNLAKNGDISGGVKDKCLSNFNKKVDKMDKDLNEDFKKYMETLLKELSTKNKVCFENYTEKRKGLFKINSRTVQGWSYLLTPSLCTSFLNSE